MPTPANSINEATTGIAGFTGTGFTATAVTQYNVLTGAATSSTLNNVAPSATSGVPLISQGSSSQPIFGTAVVAGGGTGNTTFTAYSVICAGTTATGIFQNVSGLGSSGNVLTSNGASALPTWQAPAASSITLTGDSGGGLTGSSFTITGGTTGLTFAGSGSTLTLGGTLIVANGGTGRTSLTNHGVLVGAATTAITQLAAGSAGQVLQSGGASADPSYSTATYPSTSGTSGNVLTSNGTNFVSSAPAFPTLATSVTGRDTGSFGTSSTTNVMYGLGSGWTITPLYGTKVKITCYGQMVNNTSGDGIRVQMSFGTGTAPTQGAAVTGTLLGNNTAFTDLTGLTVQGVPFSQTYIVTGLSVSTAYWFDLAFEAITGGTATIIRPAYTAIELIS